jgi:hypothetical protein
MWQDGLRIGLSNFPAWRMVLKIGRTAYFYWEYGHGKKHGAVTLWRKKK